MAELGRIKALFHAVADAADPERALREQTDASPEEAARVLRLLGHAKEPTRFSRPLAQAAEALQAAELQPGDHLGPWLLGEPLGEGGMGLVFSAERDDGHYRQRAALKLLRGWSALGAQEGQARLARERQILASLNHPHIARLLDGGSTPAGRPYLVMEYVDGQPIDRHAEERQLDLAARLRLFDSVCEAVAHAHARLVIHCDIKPGNVLVNGEGQVRLLDFGIAQLAGQGDAQDFSPAATPGYAPPEQLAGERPAPAWDVYALGRLLQRLCGACAGRRASELKAVVAKACADDPAQRYAGVPALQEDLQRLRRHEPLVALRGSGPLYPLRKALRRRWPWALTGLLGLAGSSAFTHQLVSERDRAQQEAATTREVSDFVVSLFRQADPTLAQRHDLTARDLLDQGRARLETQLKDQPAQRARLLEVLADVYDGLGARPKALEAFEEALRTGTLTPEREARLQVRRALLLANSGRSEEAVVAGQRARALALGLRPQDVSLLATIENRLGVALTNVGRFDEAEPLLQASLARYLGLYGEANGNSSSVLHNLARLALRRDQMDAAESLFRRALAAGRAGRGAQADETLDTQTQLARLLADRQRFDEALQLLRDATRTREAVWGPASEHLASALNELGVVELDAGISQDAERTLRRALEIELGLAAGKPSRQLAIVQHNLAKVLLATGSPEAGPLLRASVAERLRVFGKSDAPGVQPARVNLVRWLLAHDELTEAQTEFDALWAERGRRAPEDRERLTAELLGLELALRRGQRAPERPLADVAARIDAVVARSADTPLLNGPLQAHLLRLRAEWADREGDPAAALRWSESAWRALQALLPPGHPGLLMPGLVHAQRLQAAGRTAELAAVRAALQGAAQAHGPTSRWRKDFLQLR
ncbi:tetratricopeptide repeat protein [Inhella sp.]|uniref:protein kinase domain-containing protein n=1 Tax=Inhella sp. TaxID=1921806 RepID=UPI0035AF207E